MAQQQAATTATTTATPNRVSARKDVAQQWASRRQEQSPPPPNRPPNLTSQPSPLIPSLCHVIGKAWQDAVANISNKLQPNPTAIQPSSKRALHNNNTTTSTTTVFPSVLQILKANALHEQVSQFTFTDNNNEPKQEEALKVLPAGYDWNQAISNMAQSRSRAFLLLDLASIVPTLVQWREHCGSSTASTVQFLYTVQFNADAKLLQLLQRSQVGLVCTNKWDLQRCCNIGSDTKNNKDAQITRNHIYDNASQTGKPDGYLRQLVLDSGVTTVVVDGPEEVQRIVRTLERIRKRRNLTENDSNTHLQFLLRLPNHDNSNSNNQWMDLVKSTQQAIAEHPSYSLTGISVDVANADPPTLEQIEQVLQAIPDTTNGPRLDLTGVQMPPTQTMVDWWTQLSSKQHQQVSTITVDVSHSLISPAGALCTRIIGVKEETITDGENQQSVRMHYYIDDGCYGSLYNYAKDGIVTNPLPLGITKATDDDDDKNNATYSSTVWGPTCDGLDRVCRDIPLPKLQRDMWLVFPNLGCQIGEGLGTAFNGFAPPDTVYCVLGYFGK